MSDLSTSPKGRALLFGSLALNIFLAAFVLGRFSMMPHDDFHHMHSHGGPGEMHGGMMPPPPPFFGPEDLFTHEEMQEDFAKMDGNFKAMQKMREDFAQQLKAGNVTADQVLAHFAEMDKIMDATKRQLQEKAARKIASLSLEERNRFADRMLQEHHEGPPHP